MSVGSATVSVWRTMMQCNVNYAVCGYMQTVEMFLRNSTIQYKLFLLSTIVCIGLKSNVVVCKFYTIYTFMPGYGAFSSFTNTNNTNMLINVIVMLFADWYSPEVYLLWPCNDKIKHLKVRCLLYLPKKGLNDVQSLSQTC